MLEDNEIIDYYYMKDEIEDLKKQIQQYKDYVGDNMIMSDYQTVDNMRAELNFYKEITKNIQRCEECNAELSYCGKMTNNGPLLDCEVCQLKSKLEKIREISECPPDCPLERWIKTLTSIYNRYYEEMPVIKMFREN